MQQKLHVQPLFMILHLKIYRNRIKYLYKMSNDNFIFYDHTPFDVIKRLKPLFSDVTKYNRQSNNFTSNVLNFRFRDEYYSFQNFTFDFMYYSLSFINNSNVYLSPPITINIFKGQLFKLPHIEITGNVFNSEYNKYKLIIVPLYVLFFEEDGEYIAGHCLFVVYDIKTKVVEFTDSSIHSVETSRYFEYMIEVYEDALVEHDFKPNNVISSYRTTGDIYLQREGENNIEYVSGLDPQGYCSTWTFMFIDAIMQNLNFKVDQVKLRQEIKVALIKHIERRGSFTKFVRTYILKLLSCIYSTSLLLSKEYNYVTFVKIPSNKIIKSLDIACPKPTYNLKLEYLKRN